MPAQGFGCVHSGHTWNFHMFLITAGPRLTKAFVRTNLGYPACAQGYIAASKHQRPNVTPDPEPHTLNHLKGVFKVINEGACIHAVYMRGLTYALLSFTTCAVCCYAALSLKLEFCDCSPPFPLLVTWSTIEPDLPLLLQFESYQVLRLPMSSGNT